MSVMISGWYGNDNSGDEAILSVFIDQVNAREEQDIHVLTHRDYRIDELYSDRSATGIRHWETMGRTGIKNLLKNRLWRQLGLLRKSKLFVFGGGSLLRDNTSRTNLLRNLDEVFLARLLGIPVFFYALGVGPFQSWFGTKLIKYAAKCANVVTVRDNDSAQRLIELGVNADKVQVVSDPALLLRDVDIKSLPELKGFFEHIEGKKTIFVYPTVTLVRPSLTKDRDALLKQIAAAMDELRDKHGYTVVLVPLHYYDLLNDIDICEQIREFMSDKEDCYILDTMLSPEQLREVTALATINLTVRLHAMIYSVSKGNPCVAINYEPKVRGNANMFGLDDYVVEIDDKMKQSILDKVLLLEENLDQECTRLADELPAMQANSMKTFDLMSPYLTR